MQRHHFCSNGQRVHVYIGGDGLVESLCVGLGAVQQSGQRLCRPGGIPRLPTRIREASSPAEGYLDSVESAGVDLSMDGRGRWIDGRFIEKVWRSFKQEDIYVEDDGDGLVAHRELARWFADYNAVRPHQAMGYATPGEVYHSPESHGAKSVAWGWKE